MTRRAMQTGRIRVGAWAMVAALLPSAACWAVDQPSTPSDTSESPRSTAGTPATARPKIPPPRTLGQAGTPTPGGKSIDSTLLFDPARLPSPASSMSATWQSLTGSTPAAGDAVTPAGTAPTARLLDLATVRPTVEQPSPGTSSGGPDVHSQANSPGNPANGAGAGTTTSSPALPEDAAGAKLDR